VLTPEVRVVAGARTAAGARTWNLVYIDSNLSTDTLARNRLYSVIDTISVGLDVSRFRLGGIRFSPASQPMRTCEIEVFDHPMLLTDPPYRLHRSVAVPASWSDSDWSAGAIQIGAPTGGVARTSPVIMAIAQSGRAMYLGVGTPDGDHIDLEWPLRSDWSGATELLVLGGSSLAIPAHECREIRDSAAWSGLGVALSGKRHRHVRRRESWVLEIESRLRHQDVESFRLRLAEDSAAASLVLSTPGQELLEASILRWELATSWGQPVLRLTLQVGPLTDFAPFLEESP
jgi:hypothetical protein